MPRSFYVTTKNIFDEKSWSEPIYVDQVGFDPDLFFDDVDNKVYLTTTSGVGDLVPDSGYFGILISEIDVKTGDALTDSKVLYTSSLPIDTPRLAEGSHLFRKDGWIYLTTAEAGTDNQHRQMISRANNINGPWESAPNNPIIHNNRAWDAKIQATGHADFVTDTSGNWWVVFLGTRPQEPQDARGKSQLGRETFLAPVKWENGWPIVNGGNLITESMPGLTNVTRPKVWRDEFNGKLASKEYYTARTPYKKFYSLNKRPGFLSLKGNPYDLAQRETPAALFRKQTAFRQQFSSAVSYTPATGAEEAGITIYLSIHFFNTIGLARNPATGQPAVVARTRSETTSNLKEVFEDLPQDWNTNNLVYLYIRGTEAKYQLGYSLRENDEGSIRWLAEVDQRWLQAFKDGWQVFTGSFWGIYAHGGGRQASRNEAHFAYIEEKLI